MDKNYYEEICKNLQVDNMCKLRKDNERLREELQMQTDLARSNFQMYWDASNRADEAESRLSKMMPLIEAIRKSSLSGIGSQIFGTKSSGSYPLDRIQPMTPDQAQILTEAIKFKEIELNQGSV